MSDEQITISVDDSEIDAAIAKLDEALAKTAQLTGQTPTETEAEFYVMPAAEMENLEKPYMHAPDFAAFYRNLDKEADAAKEKADDVLGKSGEIKGLDSASSRVIRMIPGLREAQRIYRSLGALSEGSIMGALGLLMVAYSIYRQISAMLAEQEQQRLEYRRMVMEARGFTLISEFERWKEDQTRIINGYRTTLTQVG